MSSDAAVSTVTSESSAGAAGEVSVAASVDIGGDSSSSSSSALAVDEATPATPLGDGDEDAPSGAEGKDVRPPGLPLSSTSKIINDALHATGALMSKDAREAINEAAKIFLINLSITCVLRLEPFSGLSILARAPPPAARGSDLSEPPQDSLWQCAYAAPPARCPLGVRLPGQQQKGQFPLRRGRPLDQSRCLLAPVLHALLPERETSLTRYGPSSLARARPPADRTSRARVRSGSPSAPTTSSAPSMTSTFPTLFPPRGRPFQVCGELSLTSSLGLGLSNSFKFAKRQRPPPHKICRPLRPI